MLDTADTLFIGLFCGLIIGYSIGMLIGQTINDGGHRLARIKDEITAIDVAEKEGAPK